jgi:hypothetical protein
MRSFTGVLVAAAVIAAPHVASAQAIRSGTVFQVSPYAGVMVFGNYLNGPLGTTITNKPGMLYGTQVGLALSRQLTLIGNVAYTSSDIDAGLPIIGGITVGRSSTVLYDAGLEYSLGLSQAGATAFAPFVQAGVGAMQYDIKAASIVTTHATNLAGNVGLGADFSIGKGMAIRLLACSPRTTSGSSTFRMRSALESTARRHTISDSPPDCASTSRTIFGRRRLRSLRARQPS